VSTPTCGSATCTHTVSVGEQVACSIAGPTDIDPDSTAQLCGPKGTGFTYLWSPSGETTRCITISGPGTYTLTVNSPTCGSSTCSRVVTDRPTSSCRCSFFYPDNSNPPRSQQGYSESQIVAAVEPGKSGCPVGDNQLKVWYNDEYAVGLGIRRVVVYTSPTDSTVTDYPVSPSPASPACMTGLQFGATNQSGLQTGNDTAVDGGRPIWPVVYVTDITLNKGARTGDWEAGSTSGIPASRVCGVWTTGVRRVFTYLGNKVTVTMDPSPAAQNHWNLGAGADTPPGGFGAFPDLGYGAEVSWDLTTFGFQPGHRYRLETILHDGDQQSDAGGDAGHGCTRVVVSQQGAITVENEDGSMPGSNSGGVNHHTIGMSSLSGLPTVYELGQNVPNPFKAGASTQIRFALPHQSAVNVAVFTVAGQRVATLAAGTFEAGVRTVSWNGTSSAGVVLAPGMYMCKLEASDRVTGRFVQVRKMVMVK